MREIPERLIEALAKDRDSRKVRMGSDRLAYDAASDQDAAMARNHLQEWGIEVPSDEMVEGMIFPLVLIRELVGSLAAQGNHESGAIIQSALNVVGDSLLQIARNRPRIPRDEVLGRMGNFDAIDGGAASEDGLFDLDFPEGARSLDEFGEWLQENPRIKGWAAVWIKGAGT